MNSVRRRVKVYQLDDNVQWEDKGTGHVDCVFMEKNDGMSLIVRSEKDPDSLLLESKIFMDDIYQMQADTLIVWNDPESDVDLALSFQESSGCKEVWEQIRSVQKIDNENSSRKPKDNAVDLEVPSMQNIDKLDKLLAHANTVIKREQLVNYILKDDHLTKLIHIFDVAEDMEDKTTLTALFNIFKNMILLNDTSLIETLFNDQYIFGVLGSLEYDPELAAPLKHRHYIKEQVVFKQIAPLRSPELLVKIHQCFRLQYVKDVVLPRALDDPTFGTINSLIFINNVEIVDAIQRDDKFLNIVFGKMNNPEVSDEEMKDCVSFLQELCNLAKHLQIQPRLAFYQTLTKHGLCHVIESTVQHLNLPIRLISIHILDSMLGHDASILRSYILSQKQRSIGPSPKPTGTNGAAEAAPENYTFLRKVVDGFLHDKELGVRVQLREILRSLVDVATMEENSDKDEFLTVFYNEFIPKIVAPLSEECDDPSIKENICDILGFCAVHHSHRIKYFILGNNVMAKALKLVHSKEKHVALAAIRLFRALVGMKDEFYNRHITKNNLFEPIIEAFVKNGTRYNLINSAIIELFEFIRKENLKLLISYLYSNYKEVLQGVTYVDTCKLLLLKHEQTIEDRTEVRPSEPNHSQSSEKLRESLEDEEYFGKEDAKSNGPASPKDKKPVEADFHAPVRVPTDDDDIPVRSPGSPGLHKAKINISIKSLESDKPTTISTPKETAQKSVLPTEGTPLPATSDAVNILESEPTASNLAGGLKVQQEGSDLIHTREESIDNTESSPKRRKTAS